MILRRIGTLIEPLKATNFQINPCMLFISPLEACKFSTEVIKTESGKILEDKSKKNVSKAMKAYLERAHEHDEFMKKQREEFQIGKRHLANMMGEDPETFTQEDIDNAIEYLFPSGLYEKRARPQMKPPEEVFPQRKAAEFDETGKPHHFLFYTGKPNYYQMLHTLVKHMNELEKFEDNMIRKSLNPDPNLNLELSGYQWLDKVSLEAKLMENIGDKDYENFVSSFERLTKLPYAYKVKDFIFEYSKPLLNQIETYEAPKPQYDSDGRAYITTYECLRKTARGDVTIRMPGTGKVTINEQDLTYFKDIQSREQVRFLTGQLHLSKQKFNQNIFIADFLYNG